MADPTQFFWDAPQPITFVKNRLLAPKLGADAFMFWFPPGAIVQLDIFSQQPENTYAIKLNSIVDWDKSGANVTQVCQDGTIINTVSADPTQYNPGWGNPFLTAWLWQYFQVILPYIDTSNIGPQLPYGAWADSPPGECFDDSFQSYYGGESGEDFLYAAGSFIHLNNLRLLEQIYHIEGRDHLPMSLTASIVASGTEAFSIGDFGQSQYFSQIRATVLQSPADLVNTRSVVPQLFNCGWISWGSRQ